jgi:putative ABC transport system substrate-binding protein
VYIGLSNVILSALPTISSEAKKMDLPIIVADDNAVREGLALASYGVNSESIGRNAGKLVVKLLQGADVKTLSPIYPSAADHVCVVNKKLAQKFKINIPKDAIIVE